MKNLLDVVRAAKGIKTNKGSLVNELLVVFCNKLTNNEIDRYSKKFHALLEDTAICFFPLVKKCDYERDYLIAQTWQEFFAESGKVRNMPELTEDYTYQRSTFVSFS